MRPKPLYEPRAYDVKVGKTRQLVKRFQQLGFPAMQKTGHGNYLIGFFIADAGNRNELLHRPRGLSAAGSECRTVTRQSGKFRP